MKAKVLGTAAVAVAMSAGLLAGCGTGTTGNSGNSTSASSGKTLTLKLADAEPANYPDVEAEQWFANEVNKETNGQVKIVVYAGGQLGDEKSTIEQAQSGIVDIGRANAGTMTPFAPKLGVFSFPFLFTSDKQLWDALDGQVGQTLFQSFDSANVVGLAWYDAGTRNFFTTKPVHSVGDMKGMKIRVMQNDILVKSFKQLGVSPTPMSASEVFSGLQSGVIDGAENNVSTYVSDGLYKAAKYYEYTGHLRIPGVLFMSKKAWNELTPDEQTIVQKVAKQSEQVQRDKFNAFQQTAVDKAKANGNVFITLTPAELQGFRDKMTPIYNEYQSQFGQLFTEINNTK